MKVKFVTGDKVFAKVRGYPYWPAKIVAPQDENASKIKYDIIFYGTGEKAVVKAEDVVPFLEKRHELGRPKKQKAFNDAMAQIESDMTVEGSRIETLPEIPMTEEVLTPIRRKSAVGRPSKQLDVSTSEGAGTTSGEPKSARGRKRRSKMDLDSAETATEPTPEVTRVGRKIKTKRLSQDSPVRITKAASSAKKKPINKLEDRCEFEFDGITVYMALDAHRPQLNCPKSLLDWNRLVTDKASELKEQVLQGTVSVDEAQQDIDEFTRVKSKEKKKEYEENEREFKILKVEGKLLQLDVKIKASLTLAKANPYHACKHLDELAALPVTSLMLKKHPEIVDTFKRLSRYIGNTSIWTMSSGEKLEFSAQAENVRNKAQQILEQFKYLFDVSEGKSFSRIFSKQLRDFNLATQKLSQDDFFSLVKEPELGPD